MSQNLGSLHLDMTAGAAKFNRQMNAAGKGMAVYESRVKAAGKASAVSGKGVAAFENRVKLATKRVEKFGKKAKASGKGVQSFRKNLVKLAGAIGLVIGVRQLISFTSDSVKAFGEAREAANKLTQAMMNQGTFSIQAAQGILKFSSALQQQTKFGDETITFVQTMLLQLGQLSTRELPRATKATLDLAAGTGKTLKEAAIAMAKAAQGQTDSLRESGLAIEKTGDKAKDFEQVLLLVEGTFGGASQVIDDNIAQLAQLGNAWVDLKETIGRAAVSEGIIKEIKSIIVWWDKLIKVTSGQQTLIPGATAAEQGQIDELNKGLAKVEKTLRRLRANEGKFLRQTPFFAPRAKRKADTERAELVKKIAQLEEAITKRLEKQAKFTKDRLADQKKSLFVGLESSTEAEILAGRIDAMMRSGARARTELEKAAEAQAKMSADAERAARAYEVIAAKAAITQTVTGAFGSQTLSNIISAGAQGAAVGGPAGAAVGAGLGLLQSSESFQRLMTVVGDNLQRFADTVGLLIEPFIPLISVIGQFANAILLVSPGFFLLKLAMAALTPVLKLLFTVFKALGLGVLKIAKFFAQVFGLSTRKINEAIEELEDTTFALDGLADSAKDAAEQLSNVPVGFKLALEQFRAREADAHGDAVGGGGAPTGGGGGGINLPGGFRGKDSDLPGAGGGDDELGTATGAATSSGGVHIHFHGITDPDAVARKVLEVQEREGLLANGTSGTLNPFATQRGFR